MENQIDLVCNAESVFLVLFQKPFAVFICYRVDLTTDNQKHGDKLVGKSFIIFYVNGNKICQFDH